MPNSSTEHTDLRATSLRSFSLGCLLSNTGVSLVSSCSSLFESIPGYARDLAAYETCIKSQVGVIQVITIYIGEGRVSMFIFPTPSAPSSDGMHKYT